MEINTSIAAPNPRRRRLNYLELDKLTPGASVLLDRDTAACLRTWAKARKNWRMTQRKEGDKIRVWRLEDNAE